MKAELLEGWLDDTLSEAEEAKLAASLRESEENRREFAAMSYREQQLRVCVQAEAKLESRAGSPHPATSPADSARRVRRPFSTVWIPAAAAAVIVMSLGLIWLAPSSNPVATVQNARKVNLELKSGDGLKAGQVLELEKGRLGIRFETGAKLAVAAPAKVEIVGPNAAKLIRGEATVRVPGKIKGFELETPTERVIDLGTSFGVDVDSNGATAISVFEGEVKLGGDQHLFAGNAVRVSEPRETPQEIPYAEDQFAASWEISFGVEALEGNVRIAAPSERPKPAQVRDSGSLLLFPEREGVELPASFVVDAKEPGTHQRPFRKNSTNLGESVRVDSFLLQYHPETDSESLPNRQFSGELKFDRPIIALVIQNDLLNACDSTLGLPQADFRNIFRRGLNTNDQVTLSDDRQTLRISFEVSNGIDQIRVLLKH